MGKQLFLLSIVLFFCAVWLTPQAGFTQDAGKIRVLFVSGGHPFNEQEMDKLLAGLDNCVVSKAHFPEARADMNALLKDKFDVVLFYDMDRTPLTDSMKQGLVELFHSGIGIFCLHHHICSNMCWDEYYDLIGGRYIERGTTQFKGKPVILSSARNGKTMRMHVEKPDHPAFQGIDDFTILDEAYGKCLVDDKVEVLLTTDHPEATRQVAWVWRNGDKGQFPVYVNMLGHDPNAWNNPAFPKMIQQGIEFLYNETRTR